MEEDWKGDMALESTILGRIGQSVGATEPAIRLLISILFGYPIAIFYRKKIHNLHSKELSHLYILGCGLFICIFNYGSLVYHSLTAILVTYVLINIFNGSILVTLTFLFHMTYLLIGYYKTATETYDITWTMPHCVLTLRLIGLAFNIADGQRSIDKLSAQQKLTCVTNKPNLLEIAAFTYFPASFLVGPQFSFRRYQSFINHEYDQYDGYMLAGIKRACIGACYLLINVVGTAYLNDKYVISDDFVKNHGILMRLILIGLWGRITLYKYISIWILTESVAICFGLTYNGTDANGNVDWTGCTNIKLMIFENSTRFQHYIDSFNVQTNHWVAEYIYKRLRFLNNKIYSQLGALAFLALWHGLHSGYYVCFAMEFLVMIFEREMMPVFNKSEKFNKFVQTKIGTILIWISLKLYTIIGMGYCVAPLALLGYNRWWPLWKSVWFFGFILWLPWPVYKPILKQLLGGTEKKNDKLKQ